MVSKYVDLNQFKEQIRGQPYNSLVQHHLRRQSVHELVLGIKGTTARLPQGVIGRVETLIDMWNSRAHDADFWRRDCAEVFEEIIWEGEMILESSGFKKDDETLFNIFQVITLNFASAAATQPTLRKFAGIKKGWLF